MAYDRPGASSGVLLGAVTLPGLLVSKLVQTSRAITLEEVGIAGMVCNVHLKHSIPPTVFNFFYICWGSITEEGMGGI